MRRFLSGAFLAVTIAGCGVSTQQEVQMGQEYSAQINAQLPIVQDPEVNRYINLLGDSIARLTPRGDLDWQFYIVDAPEVNAFAVPGGFIYVNRGLIERTQRMNQLAGVLGHEIGHVVERHSIEQMQQMQGAQVGVALGCVLLNACGSDLAQAGINIGANAIFAKFSRDDEREADEVGIQNIVRAGIHPDGVPAMFEILLAERQRSPAALETWFATHPTEQSRIDETRRIIAGIDPAILRTLTRDSQRYQQFKSRLASLPRTQARR